MIWLVVLAVVLLCIFSLNFRLVLFNLPLVIYNGCIDMYKYIRYKEKNICPTGFFKIYVGLFGKGKTLSAVKEIVDLYNQYNGKKVWCRERKKFVTQRVVILSNVKLNNIPYRNLENLGQFVDYAKKMHEYDMENDTLTIVLGFIDEMGAELNSRNFKSNINASVLNTFLCCRHYHMGIIGTAQRFNHVDALIRQVTQTVVMCDKLWRLQRQYVYDAWELENASSADDIKPLYKTGFFVCNKHYNAYDTMAVVEKLEKDWKDGQMFSDEEILNLQNNNSINIDVDTKPKKSLFKRKKNKAA